MNLQNIIRTGYPKINYMTQIAGDQGGVVVATDEKGHIDKGDLESRLVKAGYHKHARSQALQGIDSLNYLNRHMARIERTGALQEQKDYLKSIGYKTSFPDQYRVAVSGNNGVVAFTDGKILGVPTDFKKKVKHVGKEAGVPEDIAAEYILFHENGHKAQPKYIFNNRLHAEMDAEARAAEFFSRKAIQKNTIHGKRYYKRIAEYARKKLKKYMNSQKAA